MMNRTRINFWLDAASLVALLILAQTGFIMKYLLPPGSGHGPDGGPGLTILGWNRHGWGSFHWWLAVGFLGLMLAHVALHWRWVLVTVAPLLRRQAESAGLRQRSVVTSGVFFLGILVGLCAGSLLWAERSIQGTCVPHDDHGHHADHAESPHDHVAPVSDERKVCGRMTLDQVARNTGVQTRRILDAMRLPPDTSIHVPLNRLAEAHGFTVPEVRDIIGRLQFQRDEASTQPGP